MKNCGIHLCKIWQTRNLGKVKVSRERKKKKKRESRKRVKKYVVILKSDEHISPVLLVLQGTKRCT